MRKPFIQHFSLITVLVIAGVCSDACNSIINTAVAEVYRWEQSDGTVTYSDSPGPNSKVIEVKDLPIVNIPAPAFSATHNPHATKHKSNDLAYRTLTITTPAHDSTIRDNTGAISITASLSPALQEGHHLQLLLDGTIKSQPSDSSSFQLQDVERGSHQLTLQIIANGTVFQSSAPITVHMLRHSALH